MTVEGVEGVYGILTGSAFGGINGCKVAEVGVKTLTGCSSVFLYWEFRVKSSVIILSSAKHQLVTRHNTTLSLVALLYLHSFMV